MPKKAEYCFNEADAKKRTDGENQISKKRYEAKIQEPLCKGDTLVVKTHQIERQTNFTPCGCEEEPVYIMEMSANGCKELKFLKNRNVYEEIQSHEEECRIESLIANILTGDPTGLRDEINPEELIQDFSNAPTSFADAVTQVAAIRSEFERLPKSIKEKFGFNPDVYMNEYATDTWASKLGIKGEENNEHGTINPPIEPAENQNSAE